MNALERQNQIGVRLEGLAREILGVAREEANQTFLCADCIVGGTALEVMLYVLRIKFGHEAVFNNFAKQYKELLGEAITNDNEALTTEALNAFSKLVLKDEE